MAVEQKWKLTENGYAWLDYEIHQEYDGTFIVYHRKAVISVQVDNVHQAMDICITFEKKLDRGTS